jgi:hypothetical protein
MKEFLELFMWVNYPTVNKFQFVFDNTCVHILHSLILAYLIWRLITIIWASIFEEQIGPLYQGDIAYKYWDYWHVELWGIWLLLDNAIGALLIVVLPFILYGLLYIWPLWLFIGLLLAIKYIRDKKPFKRIKKVKKEPKTNKYKTKLMEGLV